MLQFGNSADDAVCQRICWIALQMAQQEVNRLWAELQCVKKEINKQEAKIDHAIENNKPEELTNIYRERINRLVETEREVRRQLSALQIRLATPSGEVLAAARCCLVQ